MRNCKKYLLSKINNLIENHKSFRIYDIIHQHKWYEMHVELYGHRLDEPVFTIMHRCHSDGDKFCNYCGNWHLNKVDCKLWNKDWGTCLRKTYDKNEVLNEVELWLEKRQINNYSKISIYEEANETEL